uniref:E3 ubiquitin-protein ligase SHPRH isoform X2 n=1 Tax=Myxine glutinosa TaxID=7769 RepID=UPI00358FB451
MSSRRKAKTSIRKDQATRKALCWSLADIPDQTEAHDVDETGKEEISGSGNSERSTQVVGSRTEPALEELHLSTSRTFSEGTWTFLVGQFIVYLEDPLSLHARPLSLCVDTETCKFWLCGSNVEVHKTRSSPVPASCKLELPVFRALRGLQSRGFLELCAESEAPHAGQTTVYVHLLRGALCEQGFLSVGGWRIKKVNQLLQVLIHHFHNFPIPEPWKQLSQQLLPPSQADLEGVFDQVRLCMRERSTTPLAGPRSPDPQHPLLVPQLRQYQKDAVQWMFGKETDDQTTESRLHCLWCEFHGLDGQTLYYNHYMGSIVAERPLASVEYPGGILADEMGLGKTVEVLALILMHCRPGNWPTPQETPACVANWKSEPIEEEEEIEVKMLVKEVKRKASINIREVKVQILQLALELEPKRYLNMALLYRRLGKMDTCDKVAFRTAIRRAVNQLLDSGLLHRVNGRGLGGTFCLVKGALLTESLRKMMKKVKKVCSKGLESIGAIGCAELSVTNREKLPDVSPSSIPPTLPAGSESTDKWGKTDSLTSKGDAESTTPRPVSVCPFDTKECRFECICGRLGIEDFWPHVQCLSCGIWQHEKCVRYRRPPPPMLPPPYHCPHCLIDGTVVASAATLIVSPISICSQWIEEISRHVRDGALKVLVYGGVKQDGFIAPAVIASYDIVLTSYHVLRSELNYADIPLGGRSSAGKGVTQESRLRLTKRYMAVPSPLVAVEWWRLCLDEAQMVECTTAKAAEMALRLSAVNRWCVTGTPVQRGLEDLYGLILFLGRDPYLVRHWWERLIYQPLCQGRPGALLDLLASCMWRTAKKDVVDQIDLPPQTEETYWLSFSPVEQHFYNRQYEQCSQDSLRNLNKLPDWGRRLSELDRNTLGVILAPLLRLRQACCHPQAVRGEFLPLQKSTMTMEELLKVLQKKCKTECEEAHRLLVCALNGLAGIHFIKGEKVEAVEKYREVLRSSEEYKEKLKTDSLQRLHTTRNLMELLGEKLAGVAPTLRDHHLQEEADKLQKHYMNKYENEVSEALNAWRPVKENVFELEHKNRAGASWWLDVIELALHQGQAEELLGRVRNEVSANRDFPKSSMSMLNKFRDLRGLQFLLSTQIADLKKSLSLVRDSIQPLEKPSHQMIQAASLCHLQPGLFSRNKCAFCKADELFTEYESKLFSTSERGQTGLCDENVGGSEESADEGEGASAPRPATSRGLWQRSELERALKGILAFTRTARFSRNIVDSGCLCLELFELWKKEYKVLHAYWMMLRNRISAMDELSMATQRFRLLLPHEEKPNPPVPNIIEPGEVEQQQSKLLNDKAVATSQLRRKLGQLLYLENLEKSQACSGGENVDPCPICTRPLGQEWSVLPCGHCFCGACMALQIQQCSTGRGRGSICCAVCRQPALHRELACVTTVADTTSDNDISVKGSHSTKVEAVVRVLLKIRDKNPDAKALIFSKWQGVLDIIAKALQDNAIQFSQITSIRRFQDSLREFRISPTINVLLLPLHTGANGLNLIEATHVLLVEPTPRPAQEWQAIGRVHRIGQTRPTFVHRFLVRGTIEEKMFALLKLSERSLDVPARDLPEESLWTIQDIAALFEQA